MPLLLKKENRWIKKKTRWIEKKKLDSFAKDERHPQQSVYISNTQIIVLKMIKTIKLSGLSPFPTAPRDLMTMVLRTYELHSTFQNIDGTDKQRIDYKKYQRMHQMKKLFMDL